MRPVAPIAAEHPGTGMGGRAVNEGTNRRRRNVELMPFLAFDHVQLAMPPGREDEARRFYAEILGFKEVAKPSELASRGGVWFRSGSIALHLGIEVDFGPARKAHPALTCDDYSVLLERLQTHGVEIMRDKLPLSDKAHCYIADPFGNRLELIEH